MRYILALMTNGRRECLERTLAGLKEHLSPTPDECFFHNDAGVTEYRDLLDATGWEWEVEDSRSAIGHCRSYDHLWQAAARSSCEHAFLVEDDQVLLRPVDLRDLAYVLRTTGTVQMTLLRTPWGAEVPHGGYIPQEPGWYERCTDGVAEWIETTRNWACAPTLIRTDLAREFAWPLDPGCETTVGPQILQERPGATFGLWGWGEPWVAHVGVERAPGAHGY